jgi:hypothetical protein
MNDFHERDYTDPSVRVLYPRIPWTEAWLEKFFVGSKRKIRFNLNTVKRVGRSGLSFDRVRLLWCIPKQRFNDYTNQHPEVREAFDAGVALR